MNGADHQGAGLRAAAHAAIAADGLEDTVRAVLERRFPSEGPGAGLDEAGAVLGMSPAMVAHIEFSALCAIAAGRSRQSAAIPTSSRDRVPGARTPKEAEHDERHHDRDPHGAAHRRNQRPRGLEPAQPRR